MLGSEEAMSMDLDCCVRSVDELGGAVAVEVAVAVAVVVVVVVVVVV